MSDGSVDVTALVRRLSETPEELLGSPLPSGSEPGLAVAAIIGDVLWDIAGRAPDPRSLEVFEESRAERANLQRLRCIAAWLLHDPVLRRPSLVPAIRSFLSAGLTELSAIVDAGLFVTDPDRREELARRALAALDLRPAGETEAQARDRLTALDSVERKRVVEKARKVEERARKVREEIARKAAEEAAAKASRE